jgi:hypothetical protein
MPDNCERVQREREDTLRAGSAMAASGGGGMHPPSTRALLVHSPMLDPMRDIAGYSAFEPRFNQLVDSRLVP